MRMPWPGEQLDLYDAVTLAGGKDGFGYPTGYYYAWSRIEYSGSDLSASLTAGDDVYVYTSSPALMLPDGSDPLGECNWIVDVLTSTATVEVYLGYDVDWNYDAAAIDASWVPAAALTVGRNVIPLQSQYRSYDGLHENGVPLIRFKVTAGDVDIRQVTLQIEPPGGLLQITGWHYSDWITPEPVAMPGKVLNESWHYGYTTPVSTYIGPYNYQGIGGAHYDISPSWLDKLGEAQAGLVESHVVGTSFQFPFGALQVGVGFDAQIHQGMERSQPNGFDYSVSVSHSRFKSTVQWATYPDLRQYPGGRIGWNGRDFYPGSTYEFDPAGTTVTTGWRPGAISVFGAYIQQEFPIPDPPAAGALSGAPELVVRPSPHGESFNLTGVQSWSVNLADGNLGDWQNPGDKNVPANIRHYIEVAPPYGSDIVLDAATAVGYTQTAPSPFSFLWTEPASTNKFSGFATFYWADLLPYDQAGSSLFLQGSTPMLMLQMPNYRNKVPDFTVSPDAVVVVVIVPEPPPPPPPELVPGPGSYVFPNPNLDGEFTGVDVHFASGA